MEEDWGCWEAGSLWSLWRLGWDPPEAHALRTPTPTSSFVSVCPQTGKTKEFPEGGHWRGQQGREGCATKNSCCIGVEHSAG